MPFNKGDFTQQGVNGHVNATVRLNEKRLVNIDLTSDEEAEGCTIAGTVTDLLNDKVYPIGAGVSGNIEITENGENINVAPYATATVNVSGGGGGGDFEYIVNENVTVDAQGTGTVSNVDVSSLSDNDMLLSVLIIENEHLFAVGIYDYVDVDDQTIELSGPDNTNFYIYTEDGENWTLNCEPISSTTVKVVVIKMPDFYSA